MSNPDDKSNSNGLGADPLQRLASFKPPRDLSLGGVKPNKKVFTPNLNVTRNKNKVASTNNFRDQKKDDKHRKDRNKNDRNRNTRNGANVIKGVGVFSEGIGSAEKQSSRASYATRSSSDSGPSLQKPTIRVRDFVKVDKEVEDQKIRSAVSAGGLCDDNDIEDFKNALDLEAPVKLPMDDGGLKGVKVKQELVIKLEPDDTESTQGDVKPLLDIKKESAEDTDVVEILRSNQPTLILMQFPTTLPGRGGSVDDDQRRKQPSNEPSTSGSETTATEEKEDEEQCHLSDLEEGKIGKLQIHQSGRVTLRLGDTVFEVFSGTKTSFHQEIVSVGVDHSSRSANLVSLGPFQHKLVVVPTWERLLEDVPL